MNLTQSGFDRRAFLKASGALTVGFSMLGARVADAAIESATTLRPPKSVANDAIDSWLVISPNNRITIFSGKVDLGTGVVGDVAHSDVALLRQLHPAQLPICL